MEYILRMCSGITAVYRAHFLKKLTKIQWWASYFVKITELQFHGKKSNSYHFEKVTSLSYSYSYF